MAITAVMSHVAVGVAVAAFATVHHSIIVIIHVFVLNGFGFIAFGDPITIIVNSNLLTQLSYK